MDVPAVFEPANKQEDHPAFAIGIGHPSLTEVELGIFPSNAFKAHDRLRAEALWLADRFHQFVECGLLSLVGPEVARSTEQFRGEKMRLGLEGGRYLLAERFGYARSTWA